MKLFDDPEIITTAEHYISVRDATPVERLKPKELIKHQLERLELLKRDGYVTVIGKTGATVFRGEQA